MVHSGSSWLEQAGRHWEGAVRGKARTESPPAHSRVWHVTVCARSLSRVWLLGPHGLQPARLPCPWDSPGKNTVVGCHALLWGSSWPRDGPVLLCLLYWKDVVFITSGPREAHTTTSPGFCRSHTKPGIMRVWTQTLGPCRLAATVPSPETYPEQASVVGERGRQRHLPPRNSQALHSLNTKLNFTPLQEAFPTSRISNRLLPIRADSICSHLSACTMSYYSIFISQKLV